MEHGLVYVRKEKSMELGLVQLLQRLEYDMHNVALNNP